MFIMYKQNILKIMQVVYDWIVWREYFLQHWSFQLGVIHFVKQIFLLDRKKNKTRPELPHPHHWNYEINATKVILFSVMLIFTQYVPQL